MIAQLGHEFIFHQASASSLVLKRELGLLLHKGSRQRLGRKRLAWVVIINPCLFDGTVRPHSTMDRLCRSEDRKKKVGSQGLRARGLPRPGSTGVTTSKERGPRASPAGACRARQRTIPGIPAQTGQHAGNMQAICGQRHKHRQGRCTQDHIGRCLDGSRR